MDSFANIGSFYRDFWAGHWSAVLFHFPELLPCLTQGFDLLGRAMGEIEKSWALPWL